MGAGGPIGCLEVSPSSSGRGLPGARPGRRDTSGLPVGGAPVTPPSVKDQVRAERARSQAVPLLLI